jgi:hypothetical protein
MTGTTQTPPPEGWWSRVVRDPRRTWAVLAAAVVVLAALGAAVAANRSGDTSAAPSASISASAGSTPTTDPTATASPTGSAEPSTTPGPTSEPTAPAPTTSSPAPGEPGAARPTAEPVPLASPAAPAPSIQARITSIESVAGEANLPGEVGGPSLRVTVLVSNGTSTALDLTSAVVNAYYGTDRTPAITLQQPGHVEFPASVAPGQDATGVFVFKVPTESRSDVLIELDLSVDATVVLFTGAAPA